MEKHFVIFISPGTFVSETTEKPINMWDVEQARAMAADIVERYNARPFGFKFITRERGDQDLDSHISKESGVYYLKGSIRTREQVEADNLPDEDILRSNMRCNNIERLFVPTEGWKCQLELREEDIVLELV